jgi:hypothetical protein
VLLASTGAIFHLTPGDFSAADGIVVMEVGVLLGSLLEVTAALIVLVRFWPKVSR